MLNLIVLAIQGGLDVPGVLPAGYPQRRARQAVVASLRQTSSSHSPERTLLTVSSGRA